MTARDQDRLEDGGLAAAVGAGEDYEVEGIAVRVGEVEVETTDAPEVANLEAFDLDSHTGRLHFPSAAFKHDRAETRDTHEPPQSLSAEGCLPRSNVKYQVLREKRASSE